jgi:hypothetical protein
MVEVPLMLEPDKVCVKDESVVWHVRGSAGGGGASDREWVGEKYARRTVVDDIATHKDDVQDAKTNELVLTVA